MRKTLSPDGAASARDPTAPSALADPGLVLVRGPDRPDLQDERKGWIMSVKLTDAQLVMMSAAAQRKDRCLSAPDNDQGRGSQQSQRQTREAWFGPRDRGETWSADLAPR